MNYALTFALALTLAPMGSFPLASQSISQTGKTKSPRLIHFSIINMSGKAREAHIRDSTVPLPVAELVALQVPVGDSVKITSNTDERVSRAIVILAADEGRLFPVN